MRKNGSADLHCHLGLCTKKCVILDGIQHLGKLVAKENGNNSGRSLIGTKSVIISGTCNGKSHQICIIVNCLNDCYEEYQELNILCRSLAGIQQVQTGICGHGPVVMFTGTVDSVKRLLVKEANISMLICNLLHHLHGQLVVINSYVGGIKHRCQLMLAGSNLIMFCLGRNSKLPELLIQVMHKCCNSGL